MVKGGSSFNGLVRAMKTDVIESGVVMRRPELLYDIDKLSMDRISVFADGELNVQAMRREEPMTLPHGGSVPPVKVRLRLLSPTQLPLRSLPAPPPQHPYRLHMRTRCASQRLRWPRGSLRGSVRGRLARRGRKSACRRRCRVCWLRRDRTRRREAPS